MNKPPVQLPPSKRTTYQFPVYRWIGWLAVAGFAIGLTMMFFISGIFGIPAPLGWAALVILFCAGAMLLDRPKLLLNCMMFYFMLMPSNRLLGLVGLPLPTFLDELFFLPFIAVIVMNWIQRRQIKEATLFPVIFCVVAVISWYVNGRPSAFTTVRVTLIMLKSYILWYYCRLTCTFENRKQLARWFWMYVIYATAQYLYNILWQQGLWPSFHPDRSGGVFGPNFGGAHLVGYISSFALLLLAGWWVGVGTQVSKQTRRFALFVALVIGYDLVFMTDTKHALLILPVVFLPFLLHPKFPIRTRASLMALGFVFVLAAGAYWRSSTGPQGLREYLEVIKNSPKGDLFYAVTKDFQHLVPYPMLGAGPGRFTSSQASTARTPLARRYIIPYQDQRRRMAYFGQSGSLESSSILGLVNTDFFLLMGDFGWIGTFVFYYFLFWVALKLFQKAQELSLKTLEAGLFLGLACCMAFLIATTFLIGTSTVPVVVFPLWILIGRIWDMRLAEPGMERE